MDGFTGDSFVPDPAGIYGNAAGVRADGAGWAAIQLAGYRRRSGYLPAITLQMASDFQLHAFADRAEPGASLDTGLWARCRHPNYLGEIGLWVGLALFGLAAYPAGWLWVGLGAIAMILMFRFASIPMMEERSLERRPEYADVMARIPMLLPRVFGKSLGH